MRIVILLLLLMVLGSMTAAAAPFAVDQRSLYHFGVSAGLGAAGTILILQTEPRELTREEKAIVFSACMVPGLVKEYQIDGYADYGDIAFDALGCFVGSYYTDDVYIYMSEKTINIAVRY